MKTRFGLLVVGVVLLLVSLLVFGACGVSQEDYDEAVAERDSAKAELAEAQSEIDSLEASVAGLEAEVAALKDDLREVLLPDLLNVLTIVDEVEQWHADSSDTALLGALTAAVEATEDADLMGSWEAFTTSLPSPGFTLHQFYSEVVYKCSKASALFPSDVEAILSVGDEMWDMVSSLDIEKLNAMSDAVNASGHEELIQRWTEIVNSFGTDMPGAMVKMADMQVWMMSEAASAAPQAA